MSVQTSFIQLSPRGHASISGACDAKAFVSSVAKITFTSCNAQMRTPNGPKCYIKSNLFGSAIIGMFSGVDGSSIMPPLPVHIHPSSPMSLAGEFDFSFYTLDGKGAKVDADIMLTFEYEIASRPA